MGSNEYPNLLSDCSQAYFYARTSKLNTKDRVKNIILLGFSKCEAESIVNGYLEGERIRQRKNKAKFKL